MGPGERMYVLDIVKEGLVLQSQVPVTTNPTGVTATVNNGAVRNTTGSTKSMNSGTKTKPMAQSPGSSAPVQKTGRSTALGSFVGLALYRIGGLYSLEGFDTR